MKRLMARRILGAGMLCIGMLSHAEVTFDFLADTTFDGAGVGASVTKQSPVSGTKVTLKTVDVIGMDGTRASKGAGHQSFINNRVDALGINSFAQSSEGLEFQNFNPGEAWVIVFDVDVKLVEIDLASQDAGAEMTISSKAFPSQVLKDGQSRDIHSLGNALVPAGTKITLKMTSPSSAADTSLRITRLTVSAVSAGK